jgi:hypothetical protein
MNVDMNKQQNPHSRFLWEGMDLNTKLRKTLNRGNLTSINELGSLKLELN